MSQNRDGLKLAVVVLAAAVVAAAGDVSGCGDGGVSQAHVCK